MRRTTALSAALSAALLTAGVLVPGGAAHADTWHALGLSSYDDMVVDQAHGRVFVSGGALVTANLSGAVTGTVSGISSARQMALTPDGSALVVANGDGLTVVNAATATVQRTIPTGPNSCPDAVAPASGLMFFTYGDCTGGTRGLGAVDLATDTITRGLDAGTTFWDGAQLVAVPAAPAMLAARLGDELTILDTTGGATPTSTVRATSSAADSNFQDLALTPDGSKVVTASGGTYHHQVFSTTDLSHVGDYSTDAYPNSVAVRASDGYVAAGIDGSYDPDVWFFQQGASAPGKKVDWGVVGNPGDSRQLMQGGLAFGAKNAYAVTGDVYGDVLTLRTIYTGPAASMSVSTNASSYAYNGTATVTARLLSHTTSRTVSIWAAGAGSSKRLVRTGTVDSAGNLTVKVTGLTRNTTFSATFDGDDNFSAGSASRAVKVAGRTTMTSTSTARKGSYHLFKAGSKPVITGTVSSPNPNGCVRVAGQRLVGKVWRTFDSISCLRLSSASKFAVRLLGSYPPGTRVRVRATFTGGSVNGAAPLAQYYLMSRR
jgi:hypothetical protein